MMMISREYPRTTGFPSSYIDNSKALECRMGTIESTIRTPAEVLLDLVSSTSPFLDKDHCLSRSSLGDHTGKQAFDVTHPLLLLLLDGAYPYSPVDLSHTLWLP